MPQKKLTVTVAGPPRSYKTTVAAAIAKTLEAYGARVTVEDGELSADEIERVKEQGIRQPGILADVTVRTEQTKLEPVASDDGAAEFDAAAKLIAETPLAEETPVVHADGILDDLIVHARGYVQSRPMRAGGTRVTAETPLGYANIDAAALLAYRDAVADHMVGVMGYAVSAVRTILAENRDAIVANHASGEPYAKFAKYLESRLPA